jgi:hypothetical protein
MKRFVVFVLALIVVVLVTSCAEAPDEQVQQAKSALEAAQTAGAERYGRDAWSRAKEAMEKLNAELVVQDEKFRFFRNFSTARTLADEAVNAANLAKAEAENRKVQLRNEINQMIVDVKRSLQSARNQLSGMTTTGALNTSNLRSKLDDAGRRVDDAQLEMDGDRLDAAMAAASQAREDVVEVLRAIEQAVPRPAVRKR